MANEFFSDPNDGGKPLFDLTTRQGIVDSLWMQIRDILKTSDRCGIGRTPEGRYLALVPLLIDRWMINPELYGEFLGAVDRKTVKSGLYDMLFDREPRCG